MIDFRVFFEVHLIHAVYDSFKIQNSKFIVLTTATDARDVEPVENAQYAWKDRHLAKDRIADRPYAAILIEGSC